MAGSLATAVVKDEMLANTGHGEVPVFPCIPGGKVPLTRTGFQDATSDCSVVATWWWVIPQANIATPTVLPFVRLGSRLRRFRCCDLESSVAGLPRSLPGVVGP